MEKLSRSIFEKSNQNGQIPVPKDTLITVIVTHFNYSYFVGQALHSVARQSHTNFECVIVDDGSDQSHLAQLKLLLTSLDDKRFRVIELAENKGQTFALFEGLRYSSGEFVSLLDPDDLYGSDFLEKMLRCHLNPCVYASVAACEMGLFRIGGSILTNSYVGFKSKALDDEKLMHYEASLSDFGFSTYYPPEATGWLWATTSSLMFRRDALEALRRETYMPNTKVHADTYCVFGAHMLGGTLFVDEVLSWRGLHKDNAAEASWVTNSKQNRHRPSFDDVSTQVKFFAAQTLFENGTVSYMRPYVMGKMLKAHFSTDDVEKLLGLAPEFAAKIVAQTSILQPDLLRPRMKLEP